MILKSVHNIYNVRAREITALLLLVILMTSLAACSGSGSSSGSDDSDPTTPTEQLKPINFVSGLQEEQQVTRSTGLQTQATSFNVWGYKNTDANFSSSQTVFPGFIVNYGENTSYGTTSNTNNWEYVGQSSSLEQSIKYWDWSATAYRFFGVAPAGSYTPTESNGVLSVSFAADASDDSKIAATPLYSQMWYSTGNVNDYPTKQFGQPVLLQFLKPFALVTIKFIDDQGNQYIEESIENFSFKPTTSGHKVAVAGNVTVNYPLTGNSVNETLTVSPTGFLDEEKGIYGLSKNIFSQTVLPASNQGSYSLSLKLITAVENKTVVVPDAFMNWSAGYVYTYVFKISSSDDVVLEVVQVGIRNWGDGNEANHNLYNW